MLPSCRYRQAFSFVPACRFQASRKIVAQRVRKRVGKSEAKCRPSSRLLPLRSVDGADGLAAKAIRNEPTWRASKSASSVGLSVRFMSHNLDISCSCLRQLEDPPRDILVRARPSRLASCLEPLAHFEANCGKRGEIQRWAASMNTRGKMVDPPYPARQQWLSHLCCPERQVCYLIMRLLCLHRSGVVD